MSLESVFSELRKTLLERRQKNLDEIKKQKDVTAEKYMGDVRRGLLRSGISGGIAEAIRSKAYENVMRPYLDKERQVESAYEEQEQNIKQKQLEAETQEEQARNKLFLDLLGKGALMLGYYSSDLAKLGENNALKNVTSGVEGTTETIPQITSQAATTGKSTEDLRKQLLEAWNDIRNKESLIGQGITDTDIARYVSKISESLKNKNINSDSIINDIIENKKQDKVYDFFNKLYSYLSANNLLNKTKEEYDNILPPDWAKLLRSNDIIFKIVTQPRYKK